MERFCSRMRSKGQHVSFSICPSDRIVLYPDDLYEEGGVVYTINEHMKSQKHCERKAVDLDPQKQLALTICFSRAATSYMERKEFRLDFVRSLIRADIPLEKAPAFQEFLWKYTKQGWSIPTPS
uniref:Uncharacterized protein n=1 Tax=Callorhinchus milii TaxID=7868 RepID=A0A4W3GIQ4_CALMI